MDKMTSYLIPTDSMRTVTLPLFTSVRKYRGAVILLLRGSIKQVIPSCQRNPEMYISIKIISKPFHQFTLNMIMLINNKYIDVYNCGMLKERKMSTYWLEFLGSQCYILDKGALHFSLIAIIWFHAR